MGADRTARTASASGAGGSAFPDANADPFLRLQVFWSIAIAGLPALGEWGGAVRPRNATTASLE